MGTAWNPHFFLFEVHIPTRHNQCRYIVLTTIILDDTDRQSSLGFMGIHPCIVSRLVTLVHAFACRVFVKTECAAYDNKCPCRSICEQLLKRPLKPSDNLMKFCCHGGSLPIAQLVAMGLSTHSGDIEAQVA